MQNDSSISFAPDLMIGGWILDLSVTLALLWIVYALLPRGIFNLASATTPTNRIAFHGAIFGVINGIGNVCHKLWMLAILPPGATINPGQSLAMTFLIDIFSSTIAFSLVYYFFASWLIRRDLTLEVRDSLLFSAAALFLPAFGAILVHSVVSAGEAGMRSVMFNPFSWVFLSWALPSFVSLTIMLTLHRWGIHRTSQITPTLTPAERELKMRSSLRRVITVGAWICALAGAGVAWIILLASAFRNYPHISMEEALLSLPLPLVGVILGSISAWLALKQHSPWRVTLINLPPVIISCLCILAMMLSFFGQANWRDY